MKNTTVIAVFWSASVLASLFIGQALRQPAGFSEPIATVNAVELNNRPEVNSLPIEKSDPKEKTAPSTPPAERGEGIVDNSVRISSFSQEMTAAFEKPNYNDFENYKVMAETWEKLKKLDEGQLYEMYDQLEVSNENGVNWNVARALYARMGELNPERALLHAIEKNQNHSLNIVLKNWSDQNPLDALAWAEKNKDNMPETNRLDYYSLFEKVAEVDKEKAFESLKNLDLAQQRNALNGILKSAVTNEDFLNVISKTADMDDKQNKLNSILYFWSQKSPLDAIAWAEGMGSENDRKNAFRSIESSWLRNNPEEAAAWIMNKTEDKKSAISQVINGWGWKQSDKLYSWVQTQPAGEVRDNANFSLVRRYAYNNSNLSKDALDRISSDELRKKAVTTVFHSLRYKSRKAAEEFLESRNEIPQDEKEVLLSSKRR